MNEKIIDISAQRFSSISEIETGKTLNPVELKQEILKRVAHFKNLSPTLGQGHCAILLENNSIDFFINFLALFSMGVTSIPLDEKMHPSQLENVIAYSRPSLIITREKIDHYNHPPQEDLRDISLVLFTSGTTSSPKGALIGRAALMDKMKVLQKYIPHSDMKNSLCFLPTFFGHGLICNSLFPILHGDHFYISKGMTIDLAENFSGILKEKDIHFFSSVPSIWNLILNFSSPLTTHSLKRVHSASAPLKEESAQRILEWLDEVPFYDIYGATEMLGWFASRPIQSGVGTQQGFTQFWDADFSLSSDNELLVKSHYMFSGYWGYQSELINGYFNTGDIFTNHHILGRSKNVINKSGIKVNTDELNTLFMKSGIITEAASFPISDEFKGEDIGVFIVLKSGRTISEFREYCKQFVSSNYYPAQIFPIESIPVNSRNKTSLDILKKFHKDHYEN